MKFLYGMHSNEPTDFGEALSFLHEVYICGETSQQPFLQSMQQMSCQKWIYRSMSQPSLIVTGFL